MTNKWAIVAYAAVAAVAWGTLAMGAGMAFGPGKSGRFVQESQGRVRGVLQIKPDGAVEWTQDGGAAVRKGRLSGPDKDGYYTLSLVPGDGAAKFLLLHDPVAPAWVLAGIEGQPPRLSPPLREGKSRDRVSEYFRSRFVSAEPFKAEDAEEAERRLAGTWMNLAEGFGPKVFFFSTNHLGVILADAGGGGLKWRALSVDGEWHVLAEIIEMPGSGPATAVLMAADLQRETLERKGAAVTAEAVLEAAAQGVEDKERWQFNRISEAVPEEWERRIAEIPAIVERERIAAEVRKNVDPAVMERAVREHSEQMERHRLRQEEVLRTIRENPAALLELDFPVHGRNEPWRQRPGPAGTPCDSPELRAANDAFADPSIPFTDEILMEFLDKMPVETHWRSFVSLFMCDKLGPDARQRIAPDVLKTGKDLVPCVFYAHPNTPLDVVEEAEKIPGLPWAIKEVLQKRLKEAGLR